MGDTPQHPGEEAREANPAKISHGSISANRRHKACVMVNKGFRQCPSRDRPAHPLALLLGHERNPWQRLAIGAGAARCIPDNEHMRIVVRVQPRIDDHPPGPVRLGIQPARGRRRRNSGCKSARGSEAYRRVNYQIWLRFMGSQRGADLHQISYRAQAAVIHHLWSSNANKRRSFIKIADGRYRSQGDACWSCGRRLPDLRGDIQTKCSASGTKSDHGAVP